MAPSLWQILIVVVLLVLLFGRGKISALMGDVAKGIKAFKKGMTEDETTVKPVAPSDPVRTLDHQTGAPTTSATSDHKIG